jgi:predicted nucleic acid-binding protein
VSGRLVVDASAVVDAITGADARMRHVIAAADELHVPEHFHVEALSALRGVRRGGGLTDDEARDALELLEVLRVLTHPVLPLSREIWAVRDRLTAYDAAYLALARALGLPLLTADRALADAAREDGRLADA